MKRGHRLGDTIPGLFPWHHDVFLLVMRDSGTPGQRGHFLLEAAGRLGTILPTMGQLNQRLTCAVWARVASFGMSWAARGCGGCIVARRLIEIDEA